MSTENLARYAKPTQRATHWQARDTRSGKFVFASPYKSKGACRNGLRREIGYTVKAWEVQAAIAQEERHFEIVEVHLVLVETP